MKNKIVKWWKQSCQRIGEHSIQVNILMIMALMIFSFYPYYDYHSWKGGNDIIPRIYIQFCGFYLMYFLTDICGVTSRIIQEIASLFTAILIDHFITLEFDFGYLQSIYWVYIIIGLIYHK